MGFCSFLLCYSKPDFELILGDMNMDNLSGEWWNEQHTVTVNLQVLVFIEEEIYYAYVPALDLTGYGNSEQEAKDSLKVCLSEFFRYTLNKDTFAAELKRLGWQQKKKKFEVPPLSEQIATNEQLREIVNHKQYSATHFDIAIPAVA